MAVGFYDDPEWRVLPHPKIGLPVLLIVENALCAAWNLLRTYPRKGFDLLTADEVVGDGDELEVRPVMSGGSATL